MRQVLLTVVAFVLCFTQIALAVEKKVLEDIPPTLPAAVSNNVKNLFSQNPATRAQSAKSIRNYNDKRTITFLYSIIDDTSSLKWSSNPLSGGVLMVGDIRTTPGIEALISIWKIGKEEELAKIRGIYQANESRAINTNIIQAMRGIDSNKASRFLADVIKKELEEKDKQYWRIEAAILTLKYKSDDFATNTLVGYTNYVDDEYVRKKAIYALLSSSNVRDSGIINKVMEKSLLDDSVNIRNSAAFYLPIINSRELLPLTRQLLTTEKDERILESLIQAVKNIEDKDSVDVLLGLLESSSTRIRSNAAYALGAINDKKAVTPLISQLGKEKEDKVRCAIAKALGNMKSKLAIEPIIMATKVSGNKGYMQYEGPKALKSITGQDFEYDLKRYEQWWDQNKE